MTAHPPATIREGAHHYPVRVYYEDTDAGGVVYHANYLRFAERARSEALRDLGVPHAEMTSQFGLMFMVRRVKLDYLAPARLDDLLVVRTRQVAMRAATVELVQDVTGGGADGRVLVAVQILLACVRLADGKPVRLPARWRDALKALAPDPVPDGAASG